MVVVDKDVYYVPRKQLAPIVKALKASHVEYDADESESIPWREAFAKAGYDVDARPRWARVLRGARLKEDLTQKELAARVGSRQSHISDMEAGRRPIGKALAKKIARVVLIDHRLLL